MARTIDEEMDQLEEQISLIWAKIRELKEDDPQIVELSAELFELRIDLDNLAQLQHERRF